MILAVAMKAKCTVWFSCFDGGSVDVDYCTRL